MPAEGLEYLHGWRAANKAETDHAAAQAAGSPGRTFLVPDADILAVYCGAAGLGAGDDSTDKAATSSR